MKYGLIIIFIAVISASFITGCSTDPVVNSSPDTTTFTYPIQNGNRWNYTRKILYSDIRPDSIRHHFDTGYRAEGRVEILYDTLINSIPVKCFIEEITDFSFNDTTRFSGRVYLANYDSGLVLYGYRGNSIGIPADNNSIRYTFNGNTYSTINRLLGSIGSGVYNRGGFQDTLILENPPALVLKYPIVTGTEWLARHVFQGINKRYLGYELVTLPGGIYTCMKTQRKWIKYDDLFLYDYHSKYGQLKSDYLIDDIVVSNEIGQKIGYVDIREVLEVTSFNINTE